MPPPASDDPRLAALTEPISSSAPAGERANHDADYDALRKEIAKLEALSGGAVDWARVAELATGLLTRRTKDLLVACYLALGLFETEGLDGLALGLSATATLIDRFWGSMFPPAKRLRGRVNAMEWLLGQLDRKLAGTTVDGGHRASLARASAAARELASVTRERFEDAAPAVRPVLDALERLRLALPEEATPAPPPRPKPPPPPVITPVARPPIVAPPKVASPVVEADPLEQRARPWLTPISSSKPAGDDLRHDSESLLVRDEVAKLESMTGGEVDWPKVHEIAGRLLKTRTKDLHLTCYFARAWAALEGLDGMATGVAVVALVLDRFRDSLHPPAKRARRRAGAIEWLIGQLEPAIARREPRAGDRAAVIALEQATARFVDVVRDTLGDAGPALTPLRTAVERLKLSVPASPAAPSPRAAAEVAALPEVPAAAPAPTRTPEAPPEKPVQEDRTLAAPAVAVAAPPPQPPVVAPAPPKVTAPAKPLAPLPDAPSEAPATAAEAVAFLIKLGATLTSTASLLRAANPATPAAYRLLREGLYLHMDGPPPAEGGRTKIPALPETRRSRLEAMRAHSKWAALLEESEEALRQFRFCLDLHRLSATALAGLGYGPAREAVIAGLDALLRRMPSLVEYTAGDGTPLAEPATRDWIGREVSRSQNTPSRAEPASSADGGGVDEAIAAARTSISERGLAAAARGLHAAAEAAPSGRDRFLLRLGLAELTAQHGQPRVALGLFESLAVELEGALERWEPPLAARCLAGLWRARSGPDAAAPDLLFTRLCALDPGRALDLVKGSR
ncbi:MAG: type VI secretion system protein TssA [Myxococcales bacterium]|nr:type VI secretion system protein TssA [Myxococcales bacterium]